MERYLLLGSSVMVGGRYVGTLRYLIEPGMAIVEVWVNEVASKDFLVLQPQIWAEKVKAAVVVAAAGSGLMSPPPPGPRQYRFLRRVRLPDQMVEEPADLGNCHGNQGFIPFRLSPFLLLRTAFACCLTTAK